jgi:type VI secretion system secreted protein Hcp
MALAFYVTIKAQKQGQIKGDVTQKGREGTLLGLSLNHEVFSPRDAASGLPTGKRMHKPLTFVTPWGAATPKLFTAMFNNETLPTVELKFWRPSLLPGAGTPAGSEIQFLTITLTNASLADIQSTVPDVTDTSTAKQQEYHTLSFTYQKIQITYTEGNVTAMDDWSAAVV